MRMRTARGMCGSVAGLAAALALGVMGAPQAVAGGPTSVLVVSPESGQSTALYVSEKEYGELERCLGTIGDIGKGRREQPPGLDMGDGSRQINVTWMVHDVQPWRVDRAYPVASGSKDGKGAKAVWIHTTTDVDSMTGTWHKAEDPARLTALFKKLGVMGASADGGNQAIPPRTDADPPPTTAPEAAGPGQAATARADDASGDSGTDWWWAAGGVAAGAAGALLLRGPLTKRRSFLVSLRGRRSHEDGPRQELRDV
ncbi:hypothetical protein M4V62_17615 [Streptomyces durmitorensis]|uniref:Uncharacterized protein n=1 Tax=Streptomyces durmitorensis TaxID=319947 RepID=A0ABY4PUY9_9ACTN|nr:hypothetical protein [Streptomyces durmitorensis]UQT56769.1 hypothetical protein M4V62_17615 [Streptomyces durmitorensis]